MHRSGTRVIRSFEFNDRGCEFSHGGLETRSDLQLHSSKRVQSQEHWACCRPPLPFNSWHHLGWRLAKVWRILARCFLPSSLHNFACKTPATIEWLDYTAADAARTSRLVLLRLPVRGRVEVLFVTLSHAVFAESLTFRNSPSSHSRFTVLVLMSHACFKDVLMFRVSCTDFLF